MNSLAEYVGKCLRTKGCVQFDPNGYHLNAHDKHKKLPNSPFYIDLRLLISEPLLLNDAAMVMVDTCRDVWSSCDLVSDVPTASTPLVTLISQKTHIPMISPRLAEKAHGVPGMIVGKWKKGQRVGLFDDLRSTGGSKEDVIALYDQCGLETVVVAVLVDRGSPEGAPVAGRPFLAPFKWSELLQSYLKSRAIPEPLYWSCAGYPEMMAKHVATCLGCQRPHQTVVWCFFIHAPLFRQSNT